MGPKYHCGNHVTWLAYGPQGKASRAARIVAGPFHGGNESFGNQPSPPLWSYEVEVIDGDGAGTRHLVLQHDLICADVILSI